MRSQHRDNRSDFSSALIGSGYFLRELLVPENVQGVAFDSHGQLYGWSKSGVVALGPGTTDLAIGTGDERAEVVSAFRESSGRIFVLRGDDGGLYVEEESRRTLPRSVNGKVRSAIPTADGWWVLSQHVDSLWISRISTSGRAIVFANMVVPSVKTSRDFHAAIGGTADRAVLAWMDDSLRIVCPDESGGIAHFAVASDQLQLARDSLSGVSSYTAISVVPVDRRFLITVSHDQSRRRSAVLTDQSCRFIRATALPDLVVPLASDNVRRRLVAADFTRGRVLRVFSWEWANLNE